MIITFYREKLVNAVIFFASKTKNCNRTKLMKLLYFLDFTHFKQTGRSVTGSEYFAWQFGPVPVKFWNELDKRPGDDLRKSIAIIKSSFEKDGEEINGFILKSKPKVKIDSRYFSNRELKILEETAEIFRDATAAEMVQTSHMTDMPWDKIWKTEGEGAKIDYLLAIDCGKGQGLNREEAKHRQEEIAEMHHAFGVV